MSSEAEVNDYLARLRAALTGMTLAEREDIVEEIRMHIRERAGEGQTAMAEVLAGLGPAELLAQQYRTGMLIQQARRSLSPWVILRATLRWALTGAEGAVVFFVALCGYLVGASFLLLAVLKPLFPDRTGLWVGPGTFDFSFRMASTDLRMGATAMSPSGVHEALGWWFIPVCLVLGSLTVAGTTKLIRFLLKRFHWRVPLLAAKTPAALIAC